MTTYTPIDDIPKIRDAVFAGFRTGRSRNVSYRKEQLLQLAYMIQDNIERFKHAINADLGRPPQESVFLELSPVVTQAMTAYKKVSKWAAPDGVPFDINTFAMRGKVYKDPQGVALIIGPFNYPIWCLLIPLIGAISAGCAVVLKPSELSNNVQDLLVELVPKYLDNEIYRVVTAEVTGTTKLLELQWDHIMYTGNSTVGRIVATAAARHLTPISLELGGKSAVIVDKSADLKLTARRVLWAKTINAGQTCTAPDYILVTDGRQDDLVAAFKEVYAQFYPEGPASSESFSRIITERHFDRIRKILNDTKGRVVLGGETKREEKYIAPTIVADVANEDSLMSVEIFGPVLPILPVSDVQAAVNFVNERDRPLALYLFSNDSRNKQFVRDHTLSGSFCVNELVIAAGVEGLPFGGTGASGYGAHCGKDGFDAFTHRRSSIDSPGWVDWLLGFRFPPYTAKKSAFQAKLLLHKIPYARPGMHTPSSIGSWKKWISLIALVVAVAAAAGGKNKSLLPMGGSGH